MTKKALIDTGNGNRILAVQASPSFTAIDPWAWVDCPDETQPGTWTYDGTNFSEVGAPAPSKWYVLKATIRARLGAVGLADTADAARAQLPQETQNQWADSVVIYNDDPNVIAFMQGIGADPNTILAPDPDAAKFFGART